MMEWKPDDQFTEDMQQPGYQEPPEPHPIKNSIRGALYLSIMILMVIGTIWLVLLAGVGK